LFFIEIFEDQHELLDGGHWLDFVGSSLVFVDFLEDSSHDSHLVDVDEFLVRISEVRLLVEKGQFCEIWSNVGDDWWNS